MTVPYGNWRSNQAHIPEGRNGTVKVTQQKYKYYRRIFSRKNNSDSHCQNNGLVSPQNDE